VRGMGAEEVDVGGRPMLILACSRRSAGPYATLYMLMDERTEERERETIRYTLPDYRLP
jgi:hypothetical protein